MSDSQLPTAESPSPEAELSRLRYLNTQLDLLLPSILIKKAHSAKRINELQSTTRALAPETLSIIFHFVITQLDRSASSQTQLRQPVHLLLVLASVSSLWRQTVFYSPQLWTWIRLRFCGWPKPSTVSLLRLHLESSGVLKLDVDLNFGPNANSEWPNSTYFVHSTIDGLISSNLHRIRTLHLHGASTKWLSHTDKLLQLSDFTIAINPSPKNRYITPAPNSVASFANAPHLQKLTLTGAFSHGIDLRPAAHWSSVTILVLKYVELDTCLGLLGICSNVAEFYIKLPLRTSNGFPLSSSFRWPVPVTYRNLKVLWWETIIGKEPTTTELNMFKHLHAPSLQKLSLFISREMEGPAMHSFCSRLPKSLTYLLLALHAQPHQSIEECIWKAFPRNLQLEELQLYSRGCPKVVSKALSWLTEYDYFPRLKRLRLLGNIEPGSISSNSPLGGNLRNLICPSYCAELITHMFRARLIKYPDIPFELALKGVLPQWTRETLGELKDVGKNVGRTIIFARMPGASGPLCDLSICSRTV